MAFLELMVELGNRMGIIAEDGCVPFLGQPPIRFFVPAHPPHNRHAIHPLGRVLRLSEGPRAGNGEGMFDAWQCACGKLFASEEARPSWRTATDAPQRTHHN